MRPAAQKEPLPSPPRSGEGEGQSIPAPPVLGVGEPLTPLSLREGKGVGSVALWLHERQARDDGHVCIAGLDEAGRGPLAGPVVAACVVLPHDFDTEGVRDSKTLSPRQRARALERIETEAVAIGVGMADAAEIDAVNILQATHRAMRRALLSLSVMPDFVIVDGLPVPDLPCPRRKFLVGGDGLSASVAAASIVAKETRDALMREADVLYPVYGFAGHKGYGAATHLAALREHGPCPLHRRSFRPVRECERGE